MTSTAEMPAPADRVEGWKPDPHNPDKLRWWSRAGWTDRTGTARTATGDTVTMKTPDERKYALGQRIQHLVNVENARVESQTDFQAVVATGKNVNHVLHLILTLVTFFLWAPVWIILAISEGEKRRMVSVNEYGQVVG